MIDSRILNFCKKYKKKLKNEKQEAKFQDAYMIHLNHEPIVFSLCVGSGLSSEPILVLDDEDLEFLYNKYSKQLENEHQKNIAFLSMAYKDAFLIDEDTGEKVQGK